ncbi:MAG: hypothetical protein HAW59_06645 [Betaproteobacteria bacterium]|nr:hypothetical protein [Betaproteobacteria bacterium]
MISAFAKMAAKKAGVLDFRFRENGGKENMRDNGGKTAVKYFRQNARFFGRKGLK